MANDKKFITRNGIETQSVKIVSPDKTSNVELSVLNSGSISFNGPSIINTNSTDAAVRITQTGTGNALVIEDTFNPDSTPVVVNGNGVVIVGNTTTHADVPIGDGSRYTPQIQLHGSTYGASGISATLFNASASGGGATISLNKSNSNTLGSQTIVASGDVLGSVFFNGSDGTNFVRSAQIRAEVDGPPGSNNIPSRLIFSTRASGAGTQTERIRIDNAGQVGIGVTPVNGRTLSVAKNVTGGITGAGIVSYGTIMSDVTTNAYPFWSFATTEAALFTLGSLQHFRAEQGTLGANSVVTNQAGFLATSSLTGATNNYGFYSDIGYFSKCWNFYANGTADNAFNGNTRFGSTTAPTVAVDVTGTVRAQVADTQDAVALAGRAGGTGSFSATITPTTLTASRTATLPDATGVIVLDSATQTLTNKTLTTPTMSGAVLNDGYTEEVYAVVDAAGVALSPTNGSIQTWTLGASRTPTQGTWASGQSMTLMIDDGTAYTVTWTSIPVTWVGGSAPTLATTGYTVVQLWKVGTQVYGAIVGSVV